MACTMILCRVFFGLALYTETFHSGPTLACVAKGVVLDKCIETGLAQIPRRSLEGKIVRVLGHHLKRSIATHCHVRYTEATVIGLIFPSVQLLVTMESKPEFEPVPIRYHNMEGATVPTLVHLARPLHASWKFALLMVTIATGVSLVSAIKVVVEDWRREKESATIQLQWVMETIARFLVHLLIGGLAIANRAQWMEITLLGLGLALVWKVAV